MIEDFIRQGLEEYRVMMERRETYSKLLQLELMIGQRRYFCDVGKQDHFASDLFLLDYDARVRIVES